MPSWQSTMAKRKRTTHIVIHCAATKASMDIGAAEIDKWHREKGWLMIGYHKVIRRDGRIEDGRPLDSPGAHVEGMNSVSVGICLVGGIDAKGRPERNYTPEQWAALKSLVLDLKRVYPEAVVVGHHDLNPGKACPCFEVDDWLTEQHIK